MDVNKLATDMGGIFTDQLTEFAHGAAEDLQAFGAAIGQDMAQAIADGDQDAVEELKAQMAALAEAKRLDADAVAWTALGKVLDLAFKAAVAAIGAVL